MLRILFMQSQRFFGADSAMHGLLMRSYDRKRVEVHVACEKGTAEEASASYEALKAIPALHMRPTNFGPTLTSLSPWEKLRGMPRALPAAYSLLNLARYCKRHRIDVIYCTEKPRDTLYGYVLARLTGAKCVVHLHVKYENWINPLVRWSMHRCDAVIGVSQFVAESVIANGYPPSKVHAVLNALDADGWDYRIDGTSVREQFGVAPTTTLLAIISRLFHWKGHSHLLRALAKVKPIHPDFKLLIVGEDDPRGAPGHGSYTAQLKREITELGLSDHVVFTGFRSDIAQVLAACDIFAMPSHEEPFGLVFLEAMAMKKPIIAIANGGTVEVVEHGRTGLLAPPGDIDALAEHISTLILNPSLREQMGAYGRLQVEQRFTPSKMAYESERICQAVSAGAKV